MRYSGVVGYGESVEAPAGSGVWKDNITEVSYFGDVVRNTRQTHSGEHLNNDLSVQNSISIVADAYANENFMYIRFVIWMGKPWHVTDVEVQSPRLLLRLGGVYNGPRAE